MREFQLGITDITNESLGMLYICIVIFMHMLILVFPYLNIHLHLLICFTHVSLSSLSVVHRTWAIICKYLTMKVSSPVAAFALTFHRFIVNQMTETASLKTTKAVSICVILWIIFIVVWNGNYIILSQFLSEHNAIINAIFERDMSTQCIDIKVL